MTAKFVPVTKKNVAAAIEAAVEIFGEDDRKQIEQELRASVGHRHERKVIKKDLFITGTKHLLLYQGREIVGITGHYRIIHRPQDAWLGWMGVREKFHGRGYGKMLVTEAFNEAAKQEPTQTFRIWTTPEDDYAAARKIYATMGFSQEFYRPDAKDAARLIEIFSRRAAPLAFPIEERDPDSWRNAGYPIDCEKYTVPDLNRKFKI